MEDGIFISRESYMKEILKKFNMLDYNPVNTPMEIGTKLSKFDEGEKVDPTFFKSLVGSLRYLTCTRTYILIAVRVVSRFMEAPTSTHLKVARRIPRYLKCTFDFGLFYSSFSDIDLMRYCDSDYAGDIDDRKNTTVFVFFLGDYVISWSLKKQSIVTLSTCEGEYVATTSCTCQESVYHDRRKHIDTMYHFIREFIAKKEVELKYVKSHDQIADIFTKPLKFEDFRRLRSSLGMKKKK
ncbi:secreted RxLR effector protein 161-like [Nicotiana tomentosiformis]|uniref:secreted RxLR effector protein 161-like n=1 Tax=Nicotiana tomentosiformis TaxID=4098 RepID=UPI00388C47DA